MSPYRIAVLFGGCSPEYSVSLESASAVIRHMDPAICQPILVGISSQGDWFHFRGDLDKIAAALLEHETIGEKHFAALFDAPDADWDSIQETGLLEDESETEKDGADGGNAPAAQKDQ